MTDIDYSDATIDIHFTYDRLGRQETVTDAVSTRTFSYSDNLQLESESITGLFSKTLTRNYEATGVVGRPTGFITDSGYTASYKLRGHIVKGTDLFFDCYLLGI